MKGSTSLVSWKALLGSLMAVLFWAGCAGQEGVEGGQAPQSVTRASLGTTATSVSSGRSHSIALAANGTVWAWGDNSYGQLGNGTTSMSYTPVQVSGLSGIVAIATRDNHSLALDSNGTLWAWGYNAQGQIGDGTTTNRLSPVAVLSNVTSFAAAERHSLAVVSGSVWAWGENSRGQLGQGAATYTPTTNPVQVPGLSGIAFVSAGGRSSFAVRASDGAVWAWGDNFGSELGEGTNIERDAPVQVSGLSNITALSSGPHHSLARRSDGTVWGWGDNTFGQLCLGWAGGATGGGVAIPQQVTGLSNVVSVAAGGNHSLFQLSNGTLYGCGYNSNSQVGDGTTTQRVSPSQVVNLSGVSSLTAGNNSSLAVRSSDGTVWVWGDNSSGQLGTGNPFPKFVPTQQP